MKWTTEKPTEAGWYWYREQRDDEETIAHVLAGAGQLYVFLMEMEYEQNIMDTEGEWSGPIEPPED